MSSPTSGKADDEASLQKNYSYQPYIKHEWEELVSRLCTLDDPKLKKLGYDELDKIRAHQKGMSILDGV
jgi:hypothetical protein